MDQMSEQKKDLKEPDTIRVSENAYVPEIYVDDEGDTLEYDGEGSWISKNEKGEIIKKVCY